MLRRSETFLFVLSCSEKLLHVFKRSLTLSGCTEAFRNVLIWSELFEKIAVRSDAFSDVLGVLSHSHGYWLVLKCLWTFRGILWHSRMFWCHLQYYRGFWAVLKRSWRCWCVNLRSWIYYGVLSCSPLFRVVLKDSWRIWGILWRSRSILRSYEAFSWDLSSSERFCKVLRSSLMFWGFQREFSWVLRCLWKVLKRSGLLSDIIVCS